MAGSIFGNILKVSTWGESHGAAVGAVVDGCPAGIALSEEYIQTFLDRRKPGQSDYSTKREESDNVKILSGVFEGRTTGTPISMLVENTSHHSADYSNIKDVFRPGHADYTFDAKYGFRDYRGGGRSSGRETIGRVAAGAVAMKILEEYGIEIFAYVTDIGNVSIDRTRFDRAEILKNPLYMPDHKAYEEASEYLDKLIEDKDSSGAKVECIIKGMPAGVGEPVFDKLDARLAYSIMSIGAVKGIEIGDGFDVVKATGSQNNDEFYMNEGEVAKKTNHSGGILGGISDGSDIIIRAAFKPTPSIFRKQSTVTVNGQDAEIEIKGRHDPIIAPRAVVVVESMAALTIADLLLMNKSCKAFTE